MTSRPAFEQVNLVVRDLDASVAFYGVLGVPLRSGGAEWPPGTGARHAELDNGDGPALELDNLPMAAIWHAGWRGTPRTGGGVVLTSRLASRDEVDAQYRALVAAGHEGVEDPHDAFFGARFAIVRDPDGNDVGVMSPVDPAMRFTPEA